MKDYVFDSSLPAFEQELHVLGWFEENFTTNPKKLKKMGQYVRPLLPGFIQRSLCDTLERSKDPVKMMQMAFKDLAAYPGIMAGLIADGHHGMIIENGTIYGISLDTNEKWLNPNKDGKWSSEDESEIIDKALLHWMAKQRRRVFNGRVSLFPQFGFTGIPYHAPYRFKDKTWNELAEVWAKEDDLKVTQELRQLLNSEENKDGKDC